MSEFTSFPKTLVLGGTGFVGLALQNIFKSESDNILFASSKDIDILNLNTIKSKIEETGCEVVVNLAAYTDVRGATLEKGNKKGLAWGLNVTGPGNIAKVCNDLDLFLVHISTDNVFYGAVGPSSEDDMPANDGEVDWYGYTKRMGEEEIEKVGGRFVIVRIAYPFGGHNPGKDYIFKLIQNIKKERPLFADQKFTPTYIPILGSVLRKVIKFQITGKFHAVCNKVTTPYEIGKFLTKKLGFPVSIKRGSIADYEKLIGGKSPYNPNGGLEVTKTEEILSINFPTWQEAVEDFIRGPIYRKLQESA